MRPKRIFGWKIIIGSVCLFFNSCNTKTDSRPSAADETLRVGTQVTCFSGGYFLGFLPGDPADSGKTCDEKPQGFQNGPLIVKTVTKDSKIKMCADLGLKWKDVCPVGIDACYMEYEINCPSLGKNLKTLYQHKCQKWDGPNPLPCNI